MATRDEVLRLMMDLEAIEDVEGYVNKEFEITAVISEKLDTLDGNMRVGAIDVAGVHLKEVNMWDLDIVREIMLTRFFVAAFKLGAGMIQSTEEMYVG